MCWPSTRTTNYRPHSPAKLARASRLAVSKDGTGLHGKPLLGFMYPLKVVVFGPATVQESQPGRTQEFRVNDQTISLQRARLIHDDRKPLRRFVQLKYTSLQAACLRNGASNRWQDRLCRRVVMPPLAAVAALMFLP